MEFNAIENLLMLLLWLASIYGITQIIVDASIFEPVRNFFLSRKGFLNWFGSLVDCFLCTSVWVSAFASLTLYSPTIHVFGECEYLFMNVFFDAMIGSALVWFMRIWENSNQ